MTDFTPDQVEAIAKILARADLVGLDLSKRDLQAANFEGSNLSAILDVLAYNTYITSYNANMISNEVFIDSATLRENVVALARNIGYVPWHLGWR